MMRPTLSPNIHFDKSSRGTWEILLEAFSDRELPKATRSTVPLLDLAINNYETLLRIAGATDVPVPTALSFEYTAEPWKGRGKPSYSDLVISGAEYNLCVEAKWTEPRYETVAEWRRAGRDEANRIAVLEGWVEMLNHSAGREIEVSDLDHLVYQMVHRAASAATVGVFNRLAYFVFTPGPAGEEIHRVQYMRDLGDLAAVMGPGSALPIYVVSILAMPTESFESLRQVESPAEIRSALLSGRLFHFPSFEVTTIAP